MIGLFSAEESAGEAVRAIQAVFARYGATTYWQQMPLSSDQRGLSGRGALMPVASMSTRVTMMGATKPLVPGRWTFRVYERGRHSLIGAFGMPIETDSDDGGSLVFTAILAANEIRKGAMHEGRFGPFFAEFPNLMLAYGVRCLPTDTDVPLEGMVVDDNFRAR
jgi:hypothetical protein